MKGENEVRGGAGEDLVFRKGSVVHRRIVSVSVDVAFWLESVMWDIFAGNDFLRDLPSLCLGICYSDSETVLGFKAALMAESKPEENQSRLDHFFQIL